LDKEKIENNMQSKKDKGDGRASEVEMENVIVEIKPQKKMFKSPQRYHHRRHSKKDSDGQKKNDNNNMNENRQKERNDYLENNCGENFDEEKRKKHHKQHIYTSLSYKGLLEDEYEIFGGVEIQKTNLVQNQRLLYQIPVEKKEGGVVDYRIRNETSPLRKSGNKGNRLSENGPKPSPSPPYIYMIPHSLNETIKNISSFPRVSFISHRVTKSDCSPISSRLLYSQVHPTNSSEFTDD
jgi:hypothetical protein